MDASNRVRALREFNTRLKGTPESIQVFKEWQMNLCPDLVKIPARELQPELIFFEGTTRVTPRYADWTSQMRNVRFHSTASLRRGSWFVIAPRNVMNDAANFVRTLQNSVKDMGFTIENPE